MRVMSHRERRLVAGGLLVTLVALFVNLVAAPLVSGFSERAARRELLAEEYRQLDQEIAYLPRLRRKARAQEEAQRHFVAAAPNAGIAGAALEERLRSSIEAVGAEYRTIEHEASGKDMIVARASARMSLGAFTRLLERLENEPPLLSVSPVGLNADAALASHKSEPLDVQLEVTVPFAPAAS
ncbi:type II secretion system protein GspM [Novosphingobium sp. MMS21-SN21R]|uniref:type II secretion system protein GspM n=1 Tax=Novosphingobium sp. MMS21-SN21R TaxID=2969298 RepID=UPI002886B3F6|nr:type II secretion system protein GspM [Novosphingobium sp. MMS21-SN21R]MDT0508404.1 type II secretion system protein GspM [Novosphingobium sp. MMS21-SN21R]